MAITINAKGTSVDTFTVGKGGLRFDSAGVITPALGNNLVIDLDDDSTFVVNAGPGPALITTSDNKDLHINAAAGGGQNLVLNNMTWPTSTGTPDQVLVTDGSGTLSFATLNKIGSPSPAVDASTGFAYIPVTAGVPTGVPVPVAGFVPMVADSVNFRLWMYIADAWVFVPMQFQFDL